jgi:hypothetical protein
MSSKKKKSKGRPKNKLITKSFKFMKVDKYKDRPGVKNNQYYVE